MNPIALSRAALAIAVLGYGCYPTAEAQTVDFERVVPPVEATTTTLADYLVQQAWANAPTRRVLETTIENNEEAIRMARRSWTDQLGLNFNFSTQQQEYLFVGEQWQAPGGNIGASVNVGALLNNKTKTRIAQNDALIARAKLDEELPGLRQNVLVALQRIEAAREVLRIRRRAEVDSETNNNLVKSLYDQGKAQFQDVAQSSEVYYQALAATVAAKTELELAQIELRTLTGLTQEQIENARRRFAVR